MLLGFIFITFIANKKESYKLIKIPVIMKRVILLLFCFFYALLLSAQTSGGPDAYGYTWVNSNHSVNPPAYQWFDISQIGSEVTGLGDDNIVGPFSASTGFQFYWYPVDQFWIGSNGFLSFAGNNIASPFPAAIPLSSGANNWVAPMLADLNFTGVGNPGEVYLFYNNDTVCVSYHNVPFWENSTSGYTGSCTFQVILNKNDYSITFNYQSMSLGNHVLDNAIGIENNTGTLGLGPMIDVMPSNSFTIKFYYPSTVTYAVYDAGVNWAGNDESGGIFVKKGQPVSLTANVKNFGNQNLSGINVRDTVRNYLGNPYSNGQITGLSLAAGTDTTITFPNVFTPIAAGHYSFNAKTVGVSNDMVAANDRRSQQITAIDTTAGTMILDYSDGMPDGGGLSWSGGGGGIAIYIEPPFYPCRIVSSRFYITANTGNTGFSAILYDNTGLDGGPGNMLDSIYVNATQIGLNTYTTVPFQNNIQIDSGGVYLYWAMGAADISLGRDATFPISRRTYEVLSGVWADYRDKFSEDFLMGISIQYPPPVADFLVDGAADPQFEFTDISSNNPTQWSWDFDDGGSSWAQNPSHTYSTNGTYNVCLIASNSNGSDTICKNVTVTGGGGSAPMANFSYDASASPLIQFTDLSTNNPSLWSWDFDDGSSSTQQNPSHTYTANGTYNVCLTATNSFGTSAPFCQNITITGIGIDEASSNHSYTIIPNPFTDKTVITLKDPGKYDELEIKGYMLNGQSVMLDYEIDAGQITIKAGNLPSGTLMVDIINAGKLLSTAKLIVY